MMMTMSDFPFEVRVTFQKPFGAIYRAKSLDLPALSILTILLVHGFVCMYLCTCFTEEH